MTVVNKAVLDDGLVYGPSSPVTDSRVAVFDGVGGKTLKDGGKTIAQIEASGGGSITLPARLGATPSIINDWNQATENGWYVNGPAADQLNGPATNKRYMGEVIAFNNAVYPDSGWQRQKVYEFSSGGASATNTLTWQRERYGSSNWNNWYRVEDSLQALQSQFVSGQKKRIVTSFEFYRSPAVALNGTTDGAEWQFPGTALSASSLRWLGSYGLRVVHARWVLVWNANSPAAFLGSRIAWADSGPSNIQEIGRLTRNTGNSPVVDALDVTAALNAQTADKQLIHQTIGDGSKGGLIYANNIDIVWETIV